MLHVQSCCFAYETYHFFDVLFFFFLFFLFFFFIDKKKINYKYLLF